MFLRNIDSGATENTFNLPHCNNHVSHVCQWTSEKFSKTSSLTNRERLIKSSVRAEEVEVLVFERQPVY